MKKKKTNKILVCSIFVFYLFAVYNLSADESTKTVIFFDYVTGVAGLGITESHSELSVKMNVLKVLLLNPKYKIGIGTSFMQALDLFSKEPAEEMYGSSKFNLITYFPIYIYYIPKYGKEKFKYNELTGSVKKMNYYGYICFTNWATLDLGYTNLSALGVDFTPTVGSVPSRYFDIGIGYQFYVYPRRPYFLYFLYGVEIGCCNIYAEGFQGILGESVNEINIEQYYIRVTMGLVPNYK